MYRCLRSRRYLIVASYIVHCSVAHIIYKYIPFKEYMIQRRKPLRVNAKGTTNTRRTTAEVDSRESSTIPMEYKTDET